MIGSQPLGKNQDGISKERGYFKHRTRENNVFKVKDLCHTAHMSKWSGRRKCRIYTVLLALGRLFPSIASAAIQTNNDKIRKKRAPCRYTENRNNNRSKIKPG